VSATATAPAKGPVQYDMPEVEPGSLVWWYREGHPHGEPTAALVTRVYARSVDLNFFVAGRATMDGRSGVRCCDDPDMKDSERRYNGGWTLTGQDRKLRERLAALEAQVKDLKKK